VSISNRQSVVISLKLPRKKWFLWQNYIDYHNLTFRDLITQIVNSYITLNSHNLSIDRNYLRILSDNMKSITLRNDLQGITFRISRDLLKKWNNFCVNHYLTRTNLILMSLDIAEKGDQIYYIEDKGDTFNRLVKIVEMIITTLGAVDYGQLLDLFSQVDHNIFNKALKLIEEQGTIVRKGLSTYCPANPAQTRKVTIEFGNLLLKLI